MVLFNTESKPAREGALNVLQNMAPQIQTAVPKYSGNFAGVCCTCSLQWGLTEYPTCPVALPMFRAPAQCFLYIYTLPLEPRSNQVWKPLPDHRVQVAAWLQEGGEQAPALLAPQCLSRAAEPGSVKQAKGGSLNHPPAPPPRLSTSIKPTCWRLTKAARHLEASWAFLQCAAFISGRL